jgi:hypothetical protein
VFAKTKKTLKEVAIIKLKTKATLKFVSRNKYWCH